MRIASTPEHNEHDARFSPDGRWIYYLSNQSGSDQIWRVAAAPGATPEKLTDFPTDVAGFLISPSGDRVAVWADRNMACADLSCANVSAPVGDHGSARVYDETFVRHWDTWVEPGVRSRIFTLQLVEGMPEATQVDPGGQSVQMGSPISTSTPVSSIRAASSSATKPFPSSGKTTRSAPYAS